VSPAEDAGDVPDCKPSERRSHRSRTCPMGVNGSPGKRLSREGSMASRAHRLCLSGFRVQHPVLGKSCCFSDGEEDDYVSTVASEADATSPHPSFSRESRPSTQADGSMKLQDLRSLSIRSHDEYNVAAGCVFSSRPPQALVAGNAVPYSP
jgi:hypothetical protein